MSFADAPPSDVVDALVQRNDFLSCVLEEPRETPELVEELGVSRSTVDRGMSALETAGFVESCDKGYRTTSIGGVVTTDFLAFMESVEKASRDRGRTREDVPAVDIVNTVSSRQPVLESLQAEPKDKRALVDELELSRSTIDRSVRELETQGLVEYSDGTLIVTPVGQLGINGLTELTDTIELGQRLEMFLEWMPMDEFGVDIRLLADADIVVAEPGDPWSMINRHVELIKKMEECRCFLPFTGLHAQEAAHQQVVEHGAGGELVVESKIADVHMSEPEYAELSEEIIATGRFDYFECPEELPYALAIIDDTVQIVVSEGDEPRALLETENDEMRDWAEGRYEEYRQQSQKLT